MKDTMIGVDLAKRVFQLHGASMTGQVKFRKKLTREQFRRFMSEHPACVVVFEACGSASYWAREMEKLGHEARLIAPQYVKPFVKRQKNDAADAEAIVIAAQRPEMRFVAAKTEDQQARAVLYEYGHVFPIGIVQLKRIASLVEDPDCDLPALVIAECQDLLAQIAEKSARIEARMKTLKAVATATETARHLQSMPGVGPLTALAVAAFAPDMAQFKCGRDFAASC